MHSSFYLLHFTRHPFNFLVAILVKTISDEIFALMSSRDFPSFSSGAPLSTVRSASVGGLVAARWQRGVGWNRRIYLQVTRSARLALARPLWWHPHLLRWHRDRRTHLYYWSWWRPMLCDKTQSQRRTDVYSFWVYISVLISIKLLDIQQR